MNIINDNINLMRSEITEGFLRNHNSTTSASLSSLKKANLWFANMSSTIDTVSEVIIRSVIMILLVELETLIVCLIWRNKHNIILHLWQIEVFYYYRLHYPAYECDTLNNFIIPHHMFHRSGVVRLITNICF